MNPHYKKSPNIQTSVKRKVTEQSLANGRVVKVCSYISFLHSYLSPAETLIKRPLYALTIGTGCFIDCDTKRKRNSLE